MYGLCSTAKKKKKISVIPPGIEPGTLSVLDSRDNRYTTESPCSWSSKKHILSVELCYKLPLQMAKAVGDYIKMDPMLLQFFKPQL